MRLPSVRATRDERVRALPGDELIPGAAGAFTHAISIKAAPEDVWPWLAQMGAGSRAGWYSYDFIDNGRRPSANRVIAELQAIEPGTLFPAMPGIVDAFHVMRVEQGSCLVLGWRPGPGQPPSTTWAFVLERDAERGTRLIVRVRASPAYRVFGLPNRIGGALIRVVHFVMERKQLIGIRRRAEASRGTARSRQEAA